MDWSSVDYCDVFISCLDSHSDGTHSLQRIHCLASDVMLHFSQSDEENNSSTSWMAWGGVNFQKIISFGWPISGLITRVIYNLRLVLAYCKHYDAYSNKHKNATLGKLNESAYFKWHEVLEHRQCMSAFALTSSLPCVCVFNSCICCLREFHISQQEFRTYCGSFYDSIPLMFWWIIYSIILLIYIYIYISVKNINI